MVVRMNKEPKTIVIRIEKDLYDMATAAGEREIRTPAQQISYWARIGKKTLENNKEGKEHV